MPNKYVSVTNPVGSNSNNGDSMLTPYLTIQYAVENIGSYLPPENIIYVNPGTYTNTVSILNTRPYITIRPYDESTPFNVKIQTTLVQQFQLNANGIKIIGLDCSAGGGSLISTQNNVIIKEILIENCRFTINNSFFMNIGAELCTIKNNIFKLTTPNVRLIDIVYTPTSVNICGNTLEDANLGTNIESFISIIVGNMLNFNSLNIYDNNMVTVGKSAVKYVIKHTLVNSPTYSYNKLNYTIYNNNFDFSINDNYYFLYIQLKPASNIEFDTYFKERGTSIRFNTIRKRNYGYIYVNFNGSTITNTLNKTYASIYDNITTETFTKEPSIVDVNPSNWIMTLTSSLPNMNLFYNTAETSISNPKYKQTYTIIDLSYDNLIIFVNTLWTLSNFQSLDLYLTITNSVIDTTYKSIYQSKNLTSGNFTSEIASLRSIIFNYLNNDYTNTKLNGKLIVNLSTYN